MNTLVMIPALGCDAGLYEKIAARLGDFVSLRTIVADRGSLAACASQVLDAVDGDFIILGTSFGGRVALETALAAPERVKGLAVIGAGQGAVADPAAGLRRSRRLRGGEFEQVAAEMGAIIVHLPGPNGPDTRAAFIAMCRKQGAELMARQSDALAQRGDLWPRLDAITCPALMLWGHFDQFSPAADGLKFATAVPHGRYVELADCGHFPPLEAPDESVAAIADWLIDNGLTSG